MGDIKRTEPVKCKLNISEKISRIGKVFEISGDPEFEVFQKQPDPLTPIEKKIDTEKILTFPAASVSAIELEIK